MSVMRFAGNQVLDPAETETISADHQPSGEEGDKPATITVPTLSAPARSVPDYLP
jgi:hypothetical protein